jgi:protoporphyrin/coproporphyrin ferrochelatase
MTPNRAKPIGVLLINLGTPEAPDAPSVRRYLAEFLSDPRVVEIPRLVWLPLLHGVILNTRPAQSAKGYEHIWMKSTNESPLKAYTRLQAEKLSALANEGALGDAPIVVEYAMRYGEPALAEGVGALMAKGCERILLLPLYPQYAASTTATAFDAVARVLSKMRRQPTLRFAPPYFDDPAYIEALAESLRENLAALDFEPEVVLASFHGLPQFQIDKGDPYQSQCEETLRLLRAATGMDDKRLQLSFQSRFGRAKWIEPYTSEKVRALASEGVKRLAIVAPGFSADCLETIEELGVEIRDEFLAAGGEKFAPLPCLNDSEAGMRLVAALARRELAGWV